MHNIKLFITTILLFFLLDMAWLGVIGKNLYADAIGGLFRKANGNFAPNWCAGILVYIFFALGILCFVLPKTSGNYWLALYWGGLFGALTYGVYDFTNYSTLANWPLSITLIDWLWGAILCAVTSLSASFVDRLVTS